MGFIEPGFDFFQMQSPYLEMWAAVVGLFVGSFLNVVALRSLAEQSIITPFSHCTKCKHRLGITDLIPILSFALLGGRCRYCKEKIAWYYPVVEGATAVLFAAVVHHFGQAIFASSPDRMFITLGMLYLTSILVAVTVTDFKEKLIPHDITYPSIILGLIFSFAVRRDLLGALAGVGVSYILFDFIAFYGLKFYLYLHPELGEDNTTSDAPEASSDEVDDQIDSNFDIVRKPTSKITSQTEGEEEEEPFEVMGGGDAVLSAVMAAWLGWEKLVIALVIGFMVGAIMGAFYLMYELKKEGRLGQLLRPAIGGFVIFGGIFTVIIFAIANFFHADDILANANVWVLNIVIGLAGTTVGVLKSGNSISKAFPFGPALAFGGMYALFMINLVDGTFVKN